MRLLRILVADDDRKAITTALERKGVDYVVAGESADGDGVLIEFPVPTDAVGDVLETLDEAGYEETYTVIAGIESAHTPNAETLMDRYADDFDPLTPRELRSKARDMSRDPRSFLAMMLLSAFIATAGLLAGSPAVVVGSMVIAPIVGPALTTGVGAITADREMIADSLVLQAVGLALAIVGATGLALLVRGVFAQPDLALTALDLIAVRMAPTALSLVVAVAAGAAAAFGLTTKGPTSLIGVMIAAALVPTAAATGIAIAWRDPLVALGTIVLLAVTVIVINLAVAAVLFGLGYRPEKRLLGSTPSARTVLAVAAVLALVVVTGGATAQQITHDRAVNGAVAAELDDHNGVEAITVRSEYRDLSPFTSPETVTVVASAEGQPPSDLAKGIETRIEERIGRDIAVRIRFQQYRTA